MAALLSCNREVRCAHYSTPHQRSVCRVAMFRPHFGRRCRSRGGRVLFDASRGRSARLHRSIEGDGWAFCLLGDVFWKTARCGLLRGFKLVRLRSMCGWDTGGCFRCVWGAVRGDGMRYDWDDAKSSLNEKNHGVPLEFAVALWEHRVVTLPSRRKGEKRMLSIGRIAGEYWTVVWVRRGDARRLISARRSTVRERSLYDRNDF